MANAAGKIIGPNALLETLISPNEADSNGEAANVVDGLFFIGRAIHRLADAIEKHGA